MAKVGYRIIGLAAVAAAALALTGCNCPGYAKFRMAEPAPVLLGSETPILELLSLKQDAINLRQEAVSLKQEAISLKQEARSPGLQVLVPRLEVLGGNLELLALKQQVNSEQQFFLMSSTNPPSGGSGGGSGSDPCAGSYCGYVIFNNGGAGFTAYAGNTFTIRLSLNPSMSPLLNTSTYGARWRYGGQPNQTGCFTVISSTEERFTVPATSQYVITVYLKANCPPNGTLYYMTYSTPTP